MSIGPISVESLSFEEVLDDLIKYVQTKPQGQAWADWFEFSDGRTIAEWIAGLASFRSYHELMRQRENSLDHAQLDSSVFNLAFNRGLLVPPATAPELIYELTVPSPGRAFIVGDFVATMGNYEVYAFENKSINGSGTLRVVVGRMQDFNLSFPTLEQFQTFKFDTSDTYFGRQLEKCTVDNTLELTLLSDPDDLVETPWILRRVMPNQVRLYSGNGVLGYWDPTKQSLQYSVLTYGEDILAALAQTPRLLFEGFMDGYSTALQASFDPDKEEVRKIARFYPTKGIIVREGDYATLVRKNFGGLLKDVYSFNTDPDQYVHIIKDITFGTGSQETEYLEQIRKMVDSKRGMGIQVLYVLHDMEDGLEFTTNLKVEPTQFADDLPSRVNNYLAQRLYQFGRTATPTVYTTTSVAVELSAHFGVKFYPNDSDTISCEKTEFFKAFSVNLVPA